MFNFFGEAFGDFVRRGIPIVTAAGAAAWATKKSKGTVKVLGYTTAGWVVGWAASRAVFWLLDTIVYSTLPTRDVPQALPTPAPPEMKSAVQPPLEDPSGDNGPTTPQAGSNTSTSGMFGGAFGK